MVCGPYRGAGRSVVMVSERRFNSGQGMLLSACFDGATKAEAH